MRLGGGGGRRRKNTAVENQLRSRETAGEKGEVWRTKEAPSGTDFF